MATTTAPVAPLERLRTYASFVRFEHTLFSLPLVLAGAFSAPGPALSAGRWGIIALAAVGARSAAMALNRLIDRRLDSLNPRTMARELPAGRMRVTEAWLLLAVTVALYLGACAALGPWFFEVAAIPLVVFALYPYLKRFTPLCHFGVGAALALAPLAGYAAAHPDLSAPAPAIALAAFALFWVSGFDIIYATLDEDFDRRQRVHSLVAGLGRARALRVAGALHVSALLHRGATLCLMGIGFTVLGPGHVGTLWIRVATAALVAAAAALLYLEQRWAEDVNLAFFKVNVWVGSAVLLVVLLSRIGASP